MALYAFGRGRYQDEYGRLWKKLVPESSKAETVQGEAVRLVGRLAVEYYRNGNMNWDECYDAMLTWLSDKIHDESCFDAALLATTKHDVDCIRRNAESGACPYMEGEDEYDRLTDRVVEWCRHHEELIPLTETTNYDF